LVTRPTSSARPAWRRRSPRHGSPPGPGQGRLATALALRRGDPTEFFTELARVYGDVAHVGVGSEDVYLISDPELIRDVFVTHGRRFKKGRGLQAAKLLLGEGLLTSEGEFHLRQRRLVQPAFARQRMAGYADAMVSSAAAHAGAWTSGDQVDIAEEMAALTLTVVGQTLFGADVTGLRADVANAMTTLLQSFTRVALTPWAAVAVRLPTPAARRLRAAEATLDQAVYSIIQQRRAAAQDEGDLLSMLLLAHDVEAAAGESVRMTDKQVRDEVMTLLLAGHETTANALTWAWYLLSEHPAAAHRMRAELAAALAGELPSYADLPRLPWTTAVLAESMRLYPPAWIVGRRALEDVELGGWRLPAGSLCVVSQWVTHRDERWWPDPLAFRPERWIDGEGRFSEHHDGRPRFAYFPFGAGTRVCVGESFAWTEGVLLLGAIGQRWSLALVPGHPVAVQPAITLRPRHGMRMTVSRLPVSPVG
jgi:cytochrome P450